MDKKKFAFFFLVLLALIFGFGIFCIVYQARGAINPQVQAGVSDSERACAIQICNVSEKKIVFSIFKEETLIQKQEVDPEFCAFMIDEKNTPPLLMLGPQDYTVEFRGENWEVMTGSLVVTREMAEKCSQLEEIESSSEFGPTLVRVYLKEFKK